MKKILVLFLLLIPSCVFADQYKLDNCIDNQSAKFVDTLGNAKIVRFQGIKVPEQGDLYKEPEAFFDISSKFVCNTLKKATIIELEFSEQKDNYGRELAWVKVDQVLLQKLLIDKGYAKYSEIYNDNKYDLDLKSADENSKNLEIGIWSIKEDKTSDEDYEINEDDIFKKITKKIGKIFNSVVNSVSNFFKSIF